MPILNLVVLLRLGGLSGWLLLLGLVPIAGPHRGVGRRRDRVSPHRRLLRLRTRHDGARRRAPAGVGFGDRLRHQPMGGRRSRCRTPHHRGAGAGRAPAAPAGPHPYAEDDGQEFLAAVSEASPSHRRLRSDDRRPHRMARASAAAQPPSRPASPPGWVPPPLPAPAVSGGSRAASDVPPIPPVPIGGAMRERPWQGLTDADEYTGEVTGAVSGAPAPISAIPVTRAQADGEPIPGPMRGSSPSATTRPTEPRRPSRACPRRTTPPRASRGRPLVRR